MNEPLDVAQKEAVLHMDVTMPKNHCVHENQHDFNKASRTFKKRTGYEFIP